MLFRSLCVPAAGITRDDLAVRIDKNTGKARIYPVEQFKLVVDVNLIAPIYWSLEMIGRIAEDRAARGLKKWTPAERMQGSVVFIGSISSQGNRGQISYSIKHKNKELFAPFVANEGYYDLTNKLWSQNEFHAGISRRLNKRTVLDVAYTRNDSRPFNANALNLTLKIKLR